MSHRILVVDDDPRLLHVVSMYLSIEGYDVDTAPNGEEGLRRVEAQRPDLVILDVMMPGIDGLEACRRIKSDPDTRHIPVVLFTALSRTDDVENGRAAGANRFINKPFSLIGLGAVIRSFLSEDSPVHAVG
ncbi:MAG TPA: response regulator [Candidatus Dormibacteraeota bacterium]|nr:response regulator [Candidatus Dormibacteraeota bacterium]